MSGVPIDGLFSHPPDSTPEPTVRSDDDRAVTNPVFSDRD